jgi:FkbM family methyltransferase
MKRFDEWWFPDHEEHLQEWLATVGDRQHGRLIYQGHKYRAAMGYVRPEPRRAIDVGAHVGLWSFQMAWDFGVVEAFEPMLEHRECWARNMSHETEWHVGLWQYALGAEPGTVHVRTRTANSSGDTGVEPDGEGLAVEQRTLDSFGFDDVDLIKIDCEGYELFVCQGARETLLRCRPVVIVEQKPETGGPERYGIGETDAVTFLESLGAVRREGIQGDYILSWS